MEITVKMTEKEHKLCTRIDRYRELVNLDAPVLVIDFSLNLIDDAMIDMGIHKEERVKLLNEIITDAKEQKK